MGVGVGCGVGHVGHVDMWTWLAGVPWGVGVDVGRCCRGCGCWGVG